VTLCVKQHRSLLRDNNSKHSNCDFRKGAERLPFFLSLWYDGNMLFFNTTEDMQIVPYLDYDKQGLFADRKFAEKHYIPLYKDKMYVSDYRHALFLMVNDVKNNNMMGRINTYQTINIPEGLQLPIDLSSRQDFIPLTKRLKPSGKAKIALLGGFGPAYGDNICGVTAYRILEEELLKYFSEIQIDIYHVQSHKFSEYYNRYGITIYQSH